MWQRAVQCVAAIVVVWSASPAPAHADRPARLPSDAGTVTAAPIAPAETTRRVTGCARTAGSITDAQAPPAGHRLLGVGDAWRFSRGAGVRVAVIDTGVTPHPRLPRIAAGGDYVTGGSGLDDCDLHGTLIAGIIAARPSDADGFAGVAPDAEIISIRQSSGAYTADRRSIGDGVSVGAGYGPLSTLARSVVRAVDLGADVVNISEVACGTDGAVPDDAALAAALRHAVDHDVVVVAAAGNVAAGGGCPAQNRLSDPEHAWESAVTVPTPARFGREILTVGAVDADSGEPAEFSLHGPWVTLAAPGTQILSVVAGELVGALDSESGPRTLAGTSYAAAYVSGAAALVRSRYPDLTANQVATRLIRTAHGGPARDPVTGFGVVDPVAALTAELPADGALPDPDAVATVDAPPPRPDGSPRLWAIGLTAAGCLAALAVVWSLTRGHRL
ncbi:MAG: type VII secretion-associated serine protease mycosin [Gordonia sp. (in: high G+C Gram-positive bacteria)]|uniref:type VII secretion-associated serine protease mycosin n=1 Tax=Gordonia sp. (in: high G+C Gram-positive bacteria) TaxID=84139 RepID=UPI0039E5E178